MEAVAHIRSDFATKFGVPRQAGVVEERRAAVVLDPPYRSPEALKQFIQNFLDGTALSVVQNA